MQRFLLGIFPLKPVGERVQSEKCNERQQLKNSHRKAGKQKSEDDHPGIRKKIPAYETLCKQDHQRKDRNHIPHCEQEVDKRPKGERRRSDGTDKCGKRDLKRTRLTFHGKLVAIAAQIEQTVDAKAGITERETLRTPVAAHLFIPGHGIGVGIGIGRTARLLTILCTRL